AAQSGMVTGRTQLLGAAAIPQIQTHHVEGRDPGLLPSAAHVVGFARALQPVQHHQGRMFARILLPVALAKNLGARFSVERTRHSTRQSRNRPRPEIRRDGYRMSIAQQWMWSEFLHSSHGRESGGFAQPYSPSAFKSAPTVAA